MTTITLPRAVVEQALEALKDDQYRLVEVSPNQYEYKTDLAIAALERALARQAEPVEPVAVFDERMGSPVLLSGAPMLKDEQPLYTAPPQQAEPDAYGYASRLAVALWEKHYKDIAPQWKPLDDLMGVLTQIDNMAAGMTRLAQQTAPDHETRAELAEQQVVQLAEERDHYRNLWQKAQQAEPVEPVAWLTPGQDLHLNNGEGFRFSDWTPLYTAPPQRKPLTEEEIERICMTYQSPRQAARAVERAHGITDPQIADRLARHGIPMPEGNPK